MEVISTKDSYELIKQNYKDFGYYANATRTLASEVDGLKTVYRRTLWTALESPKGKMIKSAVLVGSVLKLHPHGEQSGVLYSLVNSKLRLFEKQGNFGSKILSGSAPRYTESRIYDNAYFYLGQDLVNHCEMVEGDLGYMEPRFLPALIPYILVEGNNAMGVGISTSIPPMDVEDLIKYYRSSLTSRTHKAMKLDVGSCVADCDTDRISTLAMSGKIAGVRYSPRALVDGNRIVIEELPPNMTFKKIYSVFQEAVDRELVDFRDESNAELRYVFDIVKGDINYYIEELSKLTSTISYDIVMTGSYDLEGKIVYTTLKSMREKTIKYLRECTVRKFTTEIDKLVRKLDITRVINYIRDNNLVQELPKLNDVELKNLLPFNSEAVDNAIQQSISKLMKGATDTEIISMETELARLSIELSNPDNYILKLYDDFLKQVRVFYENKTKYRGESEVGNFKASVRGGMLVVEESDKAPDKSYALLLCKTGWIKMVELNRAYAIDISNYVGYTLVNKEDRVIITCDGMVYGTVFECDKLAELGEGYVMTTKISNYVGVVGGAIKLENGVEVNPIDFTYPRKAAPWNIGGKFKSVIIKDDKNFVQF